MSPSEAFRDDRAHLLHDDRWSPDRPTVALIGTVAIGITVYEIAEDLVGGAPKHESRAHAGELVTLVDMDQFIEGKFDPDAGWVEVVARAYEMHDHLIETLHNHVVTEKAIEVWR